MWKCDMEDWCVLKVLLMLVGKWLYVWLILVYY